MTSFVVAVFTVCNKYGLYVDTLVVLAWFVLNLSVCRADFFSILMILKLCEMLIVLPTTELTCLCNLARY